MSLPSKRTEFILKILFFSAVVYFPLFLHLEDLPIRLWDEGRLAVSAYEMSESGDYLVVHYNGKPEMWSTKPPMMIWLQSLSLRIFGTNELAIRLPAALAALFTCLALLLFAARFLKSYWLGMFAVLVLVTSDGYIDWHVARTGDYEALLILGTTVYAFSFFIFLETNKTRFLYLAVAFLIVGALTKGIAALLFIPALFLYSLVKKKLLPLLKNPHLYGGIALFLLFVGGYYFLREQFNPGYFSTVMENELGGRYLETLEGHSAPYWFYFRNIIDSHFTPWYLLIPVGLLFGVFHRQQVIRDLSIYLALLILVYFLVVSGAKTRILWYDAPLFPFLALLAAIFVWYWFDIISNATLFTLHLQKNVVPYAFVFLVFVSSYAKILNKVYKPVEGEWVREYNMMRYLQKGLQGRKDLNGYLYCDEKLAPAIFYVHALKDKGVDIDFGDYRTLKPADIAMVFKPELSREIVRRYEATVLETKPNFKVYRIEAVCELLSLDHP